MPDFVFNLLIYLLDLSPNGQVISPGQFDLMEGRKTQTSLYLKEMVEVRNSSFPLIFCDVYCDRSESDIIVLVLPVN